MKRDGHFCDEAEREGNKKFRPRVTAEAGRLGRRKRKSTNRLLKRVAEGDIQRKERFEALKAADVLCSRHSVDQCSTDSDDS